MLKRENDPTQERESAMFAIEHETSIELVQRIQHSSWHRFLTNDQLAQLRQLQVGHRLHLATICANYIHIMRLPNRIALYPESGTFEPMSRVLATLGCLAHGSKFRSGAPLTRELIAI